MIAQNDASLPSAWLDADAVVNEQLRKFSFQKLKTTRIVETVTAPSVGSVNLITRLTEFPKATKANHSLLTYSLRCGSQRVEKLITCFPVAAAFVREINSVDRMGSEQLIRLRFNAFVDSFPDVGVTGRRLVYPN